MHFIKGALLGMLVGGSVAFMEHDSMKSMFKKGKKEVMKLKNKYDM